MSKNTETKRAPYRWLAAAQLFVGIGAVPAAIGLIGDPTGAALGMDQAWLAGSPFRDFLIPGLFLLVVNGFAQLISGVLAWRRHPLAAWGGMLLGLFLMTWIMIQVAIVGFSWLFHPVYFGLGLLQVWLGWRLYREKN